MNTQTLATTPDPVTIRRVALIRPHLFGFELVPLRESDRGAGSAGPRRRTGVRLGGRGCGEAAPSHDRRLGAVGE